MSIALKAATVLFSFGGVILACAFSSADGYHPWGTRLLYFTQLSNIWIGAICLCILLCNAFGKRGGRASVKPWMYTLKFIFTVSIALTGIIFCGLLAPFADDSYNAWSFYSIFNHAVVPVLALVDFYVDPYPLVFKRRNILYSAMPPFVYFILCIILNVLNVDFGKGEPYPYIFLNFKTKAGFFGIVASDPYPIVGSFYWLLVCFAVIIGVAYLLYRLHPSTMGARRKSKD
ncbi:MAG: hypothetical protein IJX38_06205 [Clostridia bacterium]|nr:hypothetical protein [Clostridia bacterium]